MITLIWIYFLYFIRSCINTGAAFNLRQMDFAMSEECDAGIGKHLTNIGNHAWNVGLVQLSEIFGGLSNH